MVRVLETAPGAPPVPNLVVPDFPVRFIRELVARPGARFRTYVECQNETSILSASLNLRVVLNLLDGAVIIATGARITVVGARDRVPSASSAGSLRAVVGRRSS